MNSTHPNCVSLQDIIREKLIPWMHLDASRLILATRKRSNLSLPQAVELSPAKALGKRQRTHRRKAYNSHIIIERWPEVGQETLRFPMVWSVVSGALKIRLGEYYLHLPAGYTVLIPSGVPHPSGAQYDFPNACCDVFIMSPRGRQMQCWLTEHRDGIVRQTKNVSILAPSPVDDLDRMMEELRDNSVNSAVVACHLLSIIWLTVERELRQKRFVEILPSASNAPKPTAHDPIFLAKQYIQSHLHQNLTIDKVAQIVHLSRTQFIVTFRQETQQSFVEYLTARRMEWACQLLRETGWSVEHISTFVGFKAPAYFHRLFRREVGMTPIQYRRKASE